MSPRCELSASMERWRRQKQILNGDVQQKTVELASVWMALLRWALDERRDPELARSRPRKSSPMLVA